MPKENLTETFQIRLSPTTKAQLLAIAKKEKRSQGETLRLMVGQNKRGEKGVKSLRALIDEPETDDLTKRIAYAMETAVRWVMEETVGWETLDQEAVHESQIARTELAMEKKR